jgi:PAS domain S-box-containing protein
MQALLPDNEAARLEALRQYQILDTEPEQAFDDLVHLAAYICKTPIASITLIDTERQWFKSKVGIDIVQLPLDIGLCPHCIQQGEVLIITDTWADERLKTNFSCSVPPGIRFYTGVPLIVPGGYVIGTLCALDYVPREISSQQVEALKALSRQVVAQLELRLNLTRLASAEEAKRKVAAENIRLAQAVASASEGIIITDPNQPDNPIIYTNPAFSRIAGYEPAEILGRNCRFLQGEETDPDALAQIEAAIAERKEVTATLLNYRKDGQPFWNELKISPVLSEQGDLLYFVGIQTDITSRKQAEEKLIRVTQAVESTSDAIAIADLSFKCNYHNQAFFAVYGYTVDDLNSLGGLSAMFADTQIGQQILAAISHNCSWRGEVEIQTKNGQKLLTLLRTDCIVDEKGKCIGVISVWTDITERKKAEALLLERSFAIAHQGELLRNVLDAIPVGVGITNKQGLILQGNPAFQKIWGAAFDFALPSFPNPTWECDCGLPDNCHLSEVVASEDRSNNLQFANIVAPCTKQHTAALPNDNDAFSAIHNPKFTGWWTDNGKLIKPDEWPLVRAITKGETSLNECIDIQCFDGTRKTILNSAVPRRNARGEIIGAIVVNQNITEQQLVEKALWENQRLIQQIAEAMPAMLYLYDLIEQRNIYTNRQIIQMLGYSPQAMQEIGSGFWEKLVHPEDWSNLKQTHQRLVTTKDGQILESEYRIRHINGEWRWFYSRDTVFSRTPDGLAHQILGTAQDITKRKAAEAALKESEERWQLALRGNNDGIWDWNIKTSEVFFSARSKEMLGYDESELTHYLDQWASRVHPDDKGSVVKGIQEHLAGKTPFYISEHRVLCKDGSYKWILSRGQALWDESGNPVRMVGSHTDISDTVAAATQHRQAEQKIREQAALLDIATDAIFVQNLDNKIVLWNKGAELLYGWKQADALGKKVSQLLYREDSLVRAKQPSEQLVSTSPDFSPEYSRTLAFINAPLEVQETLASEGEWQGELHQVTREGKEIIVYSRWTLVRDSEEIPKSILVVNTDITQKKQLEAQFLRAQRMESIGTLAGGIAHDLNNVLTPIMMAVQLLETQLTDDWSKRLLPILKVNTKRGAALIKQVLSFARGVEGDRAILQVSHLLSEIKQIARHTFPKSIEFYTDLPQNLWPVCGDATQLHQVFMNLCVNARDAMPYGGTLSVEGENIFIDETYVRMNIDARVGPYIAITVSDTGNGIDASIINRIFEPFFTTKEVGKGTGIGLSTVMVIVKSHNGFVNVYSEVGTGTQFKVYLPAVEGNEAQQPEELELPLGKGELVLVVDDEAAIREVTKASLETYGYKVICANDGIEAIALYAQQKLEISLVLVDMMMPFMEGTTTIRTLQKINPKVKVVASSGVPSSEQLAKEAGTGVKAFLLKPYTAKELLKTLNQVVNAN